MIEKIKNILGSDNLKAKFAKGGLALSVGAVFENGARFFRNIILTRLIAPEHFGLMATILAVISTFQAFTEVGVRQAVIHNKRGSSIEFLNVAWWFSSFRGLLLFTLAITTAPLVCKFFNSPELLFPIRVTYIVLLFNGIISPRVHVLEKELRYSRWIVIQQGSAFLGIVVSIFTSITYHNIWPLVLGYTIEYLSICILSFILVPFKPYLSFDRSSLHELIRFARGMFGLPILTAIFQRLDIFAIGKLLSMTELGLYSIAQSFAFAPNVAFAKIVRPLILPLFSQMQDNKEALQKNIVKITKYLAIITTPFIGFLIVFAKPLLSIIYGSQYGAASIAFSILMLYVALMFYSAILMQLYFAIGRPDLHRNFALIRVAIGCSLIYPATIYLGLSGAALTILVSMFFLFSMQLIWTQKLIGLKLYTFLNSLLSGLCLAGIVILSGLVFKTIFIGKDILAISLGFLLCIVVWTAAFFKDIIVNHFDINLVSFKKIK